MNLRFAYTALPLHVFNVSYTFRSFMGHHQRENKYKGFIKYLYGSSLGNVPRAYIK